MEERELYEHLEQDYDGLYYWFMNKGVEYLYNVKELEEFLNWWNKSETKKGLYWKGTRLYFTFKGSKYYLSWTFYDKTRLITAVSKLKALGAQNIVLNYGTLD